MCIISYANFILLDMFLINFSSYSKSENLLWMQIHNQKSMKSFQLFLKLTPVEESNGKFEQENGEFMLSVFEIMNRAFKIQIA